MTARSLSLRQRIYILTVVALAPAYGLIIYNEVFLRQARLEQVHAAAYRVGEQASQEIQRIINGTEAVLRVLAREPSIREFQTDDCGPFLADVVADLPQLTGISVADAKGVLRCRADMPAVTTDIEGREYFQEAVQSGRFVVGQYQKSRISGEATLPMAFPIKNDAGATTGVMIAGHSLSWLNDMLKKRNLPKGDALTIADSGGVIVARYPFPERFVGTRIPDSFLDLVTADAPGTREVISQDGTRRIIGYFPVSHSPYPLYVSAGVGYDEAMRQVRDASISGLIITVLGSLLSFTLALVFGRRLIRQPIDRLLATVAAWRGGNEIARTGMAGGSNEIAQVGASIDRFMDELVQARAERKATEEQRELLARELEHRVKNTLATVRAVAGQTFRGAQSEEALMRFDGRLGAMASALDNLNRSGWKSADLKDTLIKTLEPFPSEQFQFDGPRILLSANAAPTLSMAVYELATNAAKYGALSVPAGRIAVTWRIDGRVFHFSWTEHGGPPVAPPSRTGFGRRMITRILALDLRGEVDLDYPPTGVTCRISAPVENVAA